MCVSLVFAAMPPCSFLVTKYTSPLTLQVLGNAKGVIAAIISIYIFLNPVTVSGACLLGETFAFGHRKHGHTMF